MASYSNEPDGTQPPAETPAQRYARDISQQRGDWQLNGSGDLVYVAPGAVGSRSERDNLRRGGDHYYDYVNGVPVPKYDADGRAAREYVAYNTGVSANGAGPHDNYADLKD